MAKKDIEKYPDIITAASCIKLSQKIQAPKNTLQSIVIVFSNLFLKPIRKKWFKLSLKLNIILVVVLAIVVIAGTAFVVIKYVLVIINHLEQPIGANNTTS